MVTRICRIALCSTASCSSGRHEGARATCRRDWGLIMGRPAIKVKMSDNERGKLLEMSLSQSLPYSLVRRARIVLMAADGLSGSEIAARCAVTRSVVTYWKKRFVDQGISGLHNRTRPSRHRTLDDEAVAELLKKIMHEKPPSLEHWSVRAATREMGISRGAVARYFSLSGVQLHRAKGFKLSSNLSIFARVRDVIGLYLGPSFNALVVCVDEGCRCDASQNMYPVLSTGSGYVKGVTRYGVSPDATTLLGSLSAATSETIVQSESRPPDYEFIAFLKQIDCAVPANLDVHLIVDNDEAQEYPEVKAWLAKHVRYRIHFTRTYSKWLKQAERWFGLVTQQAISRGLFEAVRQFISSIQRYSDQCSLHKRPFVWTATSDSVLEKIERLCKCDSRTKG